MFLIIIAKIIIRFVFVPADHLLARMYQPAVFLLLLLERAVVIMGRRGIFVLYYDRRHFV